MTNAEIRDHAVDYVATHQADNSQIFTTPDCKIDRVNNVTYVQVWVAILDTEDK